MATTSGSTIQGRTTFVTTAGFTGTAAHTSVGLSANGTSVLTTVVPADGAELISGTFTITTVGAVTTSGTNAWSISDGTNAIATIAAFDVTQAIGTILPLVMGSATNGRNIATTSGARLILTNTEAGTVGTAVSGIFNFVWAL